MQADGIRDVSQLVVPRVGRVVPQAGEVPGWELQDAAGEPVVAVVQYLTEFAARDMSPASVRSYALALLRWHRVLSALGVEWDKAATVEARDFVLWMRQARKHRPTQPSMLVPGSVNAKTGKRYPGDGYAPRTINHNLTVVHEFTRSIRMRAAGRCATRCQSGGARRLGCALLCRVCAPSDRG